MNNGVFKGGGCSKCFVGSNPLRKLQIFCKSEGKEVEKKKYIKRDGIGIVC